MNKLTTNLIKNNTLEEFNSSLNDLKQEFHRTGRFDDANANQL